MSILFSNDPCSAYTLEIVDSFQKLKPNGYLGRTALQKLVYFCKTVGVPIPCSFEIYNFGPYSEEVTRSVNYLLADEVLDDVSQNPRYSSYRVGLTATQFPEALRREPQKYRARIDDIVDGLGELTPNELELVATLHFVNAKQKGLLGERPTRSFVITKFRSIKGDKFSGTQIDNWYEWLDKSKLL